MYINYKTSLELIVDQLITLCSLSKCQVFLSLPIQF